MFMGHRLVKVGNGDWIFDITTFKGYKVKKKSNDDIDNFESVFRVETNSQNEVIFTRFEYVPIKVMRETKEIIQERFKDTEIN